MAEPSPTVVGVLGGTGFIGSVITAELRRRGHVVVPVGAPRLRWTGPLPDRRDRARPAGPALPGSAVPGSALLGSDVLGPALLDAARAVASGAAVEALAAPLDGVHVLVNAAGIADAAAPASPGLYGANALLPLLAARACRSAGVGRFVHLSSISVQGDGPLDETPRLAPNTPYSHSRALGEALLLAEEDGRHVIFRPTSVHGPGRGVTRALVRLARSPVSCVAGDGSKPTPQVLVEDVANAVAHLALAAGPVPPIVLQPPNGMTTGLLLRLLGGREPRRLPVRSARAAVRSLKACARINTRAHAQVRRIDMLLFGRSQVRGWLAEQGASPVLRHEAWRSLAVESGEVGEPERERA